MPTNQPPHTPPAAAGRITPDDPRYQALIDKQFNKRFRAQPDYIRPVHSTKQVIAAVEEAVHEGHRLVATSGGHCLEGFVSDPEVKAIIDLSPMKRIEFDQAMGAVMVEAGATVGDTFRALFDRWGTVLPLGESPAIGMGGHIPGGVFGFLCRQLGLAADYLHAVEVVTVGLDGKATATIATGRSSDPHRELWWAHTGGGAGNFGIATRFWFRDPAAPGHDPAKILPAAPDSITTFKATWSWETLDEASFQRLVRNHGEWAERNSGAESANTTLWTLLELHRKQFGSIVVRGVSTAGAGAVAQMDAHLSALNEGITPGRATDLARMSWPEFALNPLPELFTMPPGGVSVKVKDALLRRRLNDRQIGVAYDWLTRTDHDIMGGMIGLANYGGRINTVAPDATASIHRNSIFDMACTTGWLDPADEPKNLAWVRAFYRDLFAETGGVPAPSDNAEGALINHPDTDLADPTWNSSGVPWSTIYYGANYPRLQAVKARWDPQNVFTHALGVRGG